MAWLEEIIVASSHRRQRVSEALMDSFEEWARSKGAVLSALATRRAASFYEAIEYEQSAAYLENYYEGQANNQSGSLTVLPLPQTKALGALND